MFSFECSGTQERSLKIRYDHQMESFLNFLHTKDKM